MEHFNVPHSVSKRPRSLFREIKLKEKKVLKTLTSDGESQSTSGFSQSDNDDLPTGASELFGPARDVYITVQKGPGVSTPRHQVNGWKKPKRPSEGGWAKPNRPQEHTWIKPSKPQEVVRDLTSSAFSSQPSSSSSSSFSSSYFRTDSHPTSKGQSQTPLPSPSSTSSPWSFTSLSHSSSSSSLPTHVSVLRNTNHQNVKPNSPTHAMRSNHEEQGQSQNFSIASGGRSFESRSVLQASQGGTSIQSVCSASSLAEVTKNSQHLSQTSFHSETAPEEMVVEQSLPSESIIQHQEPSRYPSDTVPPPPLNEQMAQSPYMHLSSRHHENIRQYQHFPVQVAHGSGHLQVAQVPTPIQHTPSTYHALQRTQGPFPIQNNQRTVPVQVVQASTPLQSPQVPVQSPNKIISNVNPDDHYKKIRLNSLSPGERRLPFENVSVPKEVYSPQEMHDRIVENQQGPASTDATQRFQQSGMERHGHRSESSTLANSNFEAFNEHAMKHPQVVYQTVSRVSEPTKNLTVSREELEHRLHLTQAQYEKPSNSMDTIDESRPAGPHSMGVQETPVLHNSLHRLPQNFCFQSGSVVQTPNGLAYLAPMIVSPKVQDNFKNVQNSYGTNTSAAPPVTISVDPAAMSQLYAPLPTMMPTAPQASGAMQFVQCMPGVFQPLFVQNQLPLNHHQQQQQDKKQVTPHESDHHFRTASQRQHPQQHEQQHQEHLHQPSPQYMPTQNLQQQNRVAVEKNGQQMGSYHAIPSTSHHTLKKSTDVNPEPSRPSAANELNGGVILDPVSAIPGVYIQTVPETGQIELERKDILEGMMLCQICEDRATGLHYGIITCEGCKGFFKRSVQNKRIYTCVANEDCAVIKSQRNRCQFCRFKKCLQKGMVAAAVREDRMPGGRNSGAVYNLYKFKYKRHRRRTNHVEQKKSYSDKSDTQSIVSDLSDNYSVKSYRYNTSVQSQALLKEERLKQQAAGNDAMRNGNVVSNHENDQRVKQLAAAAASAAVLGSTPTVPATLAQNVTLSNDQSPTKTTKKTPNMLLIEKSIACECFHDISRFAYRVEHESNVVRMLGNLGNDIVTHLVHWAQKLPFFSQIPMPQHLHILTSKWHEILFLTTATYQTIVDNGRKPRSSEPSCKLLQVDFKRKLSKNIQRLHMYMTRRLRQTMTLEELQKEVQQVMESVTLVILNFARLKVTLAEYVCLKVILLLNLVGKDCTELTCSIQQQYMEALEEYTASHFPENPNRFGELILLLSEVQSAAALLLQSRMIFVPFLLSNLAREHNPENYGSASQLPSQINRAKGQGKQPSPLSLQKELRNDKNTEDTMMATDESYSSVAKSGNGKQSTSPIMMSNAEQFSELHIE